MEPDGHGDRAYKLLPYPRAGHEAGHSYKPGHMPGPMPGTNHTNMSPDFALFMYKVESKLPLFCKVFTFSAP